MLRETFLYELFTRQGPEGLCVRTRRSTSSGVRGREPGDVVACSLGHTDEVVLTQLRRKAAIVPASQCVLGPSESMHGSPRGVPSVQ